MITFDLSKALDEGPSGEKKKDRMKGSVHPYLLALKPHFEAAASVDNAAHMRAYMKDIFVFYGIKADERREIQKEFWKSEDLPELADLSTIVKDAWSLPQREYQYFAMELVKKFMKQLEPEHFKMIEGMLGGKQWWDSIDFVAPQLAGGMFQRFPELRTQAVEKWTASRNMWLNRSAIIFQLKYKDNTNLNILFGVIEKFKGSKEFFIQKAIGWALREYSKTSPKAVSAFVKSTELASLSQREALKRVV